MGPMLDGGPDYIPLSNPRISSGPIFFDIPRIHHGPTGGPGMPGLIGGCSLKDYLKDPTLDQETRGVLTLALEAGFIALSPEKNQCIFGQTFNLKRSLGFTAHLKIRKVMNEEWIADVEINTGSLHDIDCFSCKFHLVNLRPFKYIILAVKEQLPRVLTEVKAMVLALHKDPVWATPLPVPHQEVEEISDLYDSIKHCEEVSCSATTACAEDHKKLKGWLEEVLHDRIRKLGERL
jgi:hypothetical protein